MKLEGLLSEIETRRSDLIQLTCDLVRIPTINPPGKDYKRICEFLSNRLTRSGFDCQIKRAEGAIGDSDLYPRYNLIARHEGFRSGDCIHFNSHTDVVEPGYGWTKDPFAAVIEEDRIFGRGACDMKGGLASILLQLKLLLPFVLIIVVRSKSQLLLMRKQEVSVGWLGLQRKVISIRRGFSM